MLTDRELAIIGEAFSQYITKESKASEKAKKLGLKSIGFGRYVRPNKPSTVVAKSTQGGKKLEPVKPTKTQSAKKTTRKAKKQKVKAEKLKLNLHDFSAKGEPTNGLISSDVDSVKKGGKKHNVRYMTTRDGKKIDVSKPAGRKQAVQIIDARVKGLHRKILSAADAALTHKNKAERVRAKKWLGELGELMAMREFLANEVEAYLLPDSEPKNDMVVFSRSGKRHEALQSRYLSIKSTAEGEEVNGLGSNAMPDMRKALQGKSITVEGKRMAAADYAEAVMTFKRELVRTLSEGKVGRDGVSTENISPKLLMKKPQKLKSGRKGFPEHAAFLAARRVTTEDINRFVQSFGNRFDPAALKAIVSSLKKKVKNKRGKFSALDLDGFLVEHWGKLLEKTKSTVLQESDVLSFRFNTDAGFSDNAVTAARAKDVNQKMMKEHVERGNIDVTRAGRVKSGEQQIKYLLGLRQATRGLGNKNEGKGYLGGIINSTPTVRISDVDMTVEEYIQAVGLGK